MFYVQQPKLFIKKIKIKIWINAIYINVNWYKKFFQKLYSIYTNTHAVVSPKLITYNMLVMICFFLNLVVVKGIVISTKNLFSSLLKAGIMYECSKPYGAYTDEVIIHQLKTFQNYYKSSCLIKVNRKMRLSAEGICLSVFLSLFSFFLWNKNIRSNSKNKKHYTIDILKKVTCKNILYQLLLIIVLVISLLKMWYRHF